MGRPTSVASIISQLSVMHSHKHIYIGILNMSEESYQRMIKRQKESLEKARKDPRNAEWP